MSKEQDAKAQASVLEQAREALKEQAKAKMNFQRKPLKLEVAPQKEKLAEGSQIRHCIGIASAKGGVGKSTLTALLGACLARKGFQVGILDADLTGSSQPHLFGLDGNLFAEGDFIIPSVTSTGIQVVAMNLMLENPKDPVIWRGPLLSSMLTKFWSETKWGKLDYLLVDLPPGTGDVPLSVLQNYQLDGLVLVTTPQDLVGLIVSKIIIMAEKLHVPILGLVENFSYFMCPNCQTKHEIYGPSQAEALGQEFHLDVLGRLPLDPSMAQLCDIGRTEAAEPAWIDELCDQILKTEGQ